jgi:hypothetical protein
MVTGRKADQTPPRLDPLHAMQFRPPAPPQVRGPHPANGPVELTVTDRCIPLVTAAYGT